MEEFDFEFSTIISVKAKTEEEALEKAWEELEMCVTGDPGLCIFNVFDPETGKGY